MNRRLGFILALALLAMIVALPSSAQFVQPSPPPTTPAEEAAEVLSIVADAGTIPRADKDVYGNAFIATGQAPDGGTALYDWVSTSDARKKLGAGNQMELVPNGNTLTVDVSELILPTTQIAQPKTYTGLNALWAAETGKFAGFMPTSDATGCASGTRGGVRVDTAGRLKVCDGTAIRDVYYRAGPWQGSINFGAYAAAECKTMTIAASGVGVDDFVRVSGCGQVWFQDDYYTCGAEALANNVISIRICCQNTLGCNTQADDYFFTIYVDR